MTRHKETLAAFNLPDGRGFRIDSHTENGIITFIEGVYLAGSVATDENGDADSVYSFLIYQKESEIG